MDINIGIPTGYNNEAAMRDVLHKAKSILNGRGKKVCIREHAEDKDCITKVSKSFIFVGEPTDNVYDPPAPQVHVRKSFDSVARCEKFTFQVKGYFFVNHLRQIVKMHYTHCLKVALTWKSNVKSPKKSVQLA